MSSTALVVLILAWAGTPAEPANGRAAGGPGAPSIVIPASTEHRAPPSINHADGASPSNGRSNRDMLDQALRDFDRAVALKGRSVAEADALFMAALEKFEAVLHQGHHNGYLYYNIANTHMRLGDFARAIVNYRRALHCIPGDHDAQRNLSYARSLCELHIEPAATTAMIRTLLAWHYETSPGTRTTAALVTYAAFWATAFVMLFLRRRTPVLVGLALVLGVVSATLIASVAYGSMAGPSREGVIVVHAATLRKGNGDAYEPQLDRPLPSGVELKIIETRAAADGSTWNRVTLPDGKDGWLRADQLERI